MISVRFIFICQAMNIQICLYKQNKKIKTTLVCIVNMYATIAGLQIPMTFEYLEIQSFSKNMFLVKTKCQVEFLTYLFHYNVIYGTKTMKILRSMKCC